MQNEVHLRMHTHKSGFPMPWPNGTLTYDRWWKSSALLIMLLEHDRVASTESFLWWGTQRCLLASSLNTDQKTNPPGIETPPPGLNFQYLPPSATHNVCDGMSRVGGWVGGWVGGSAGGWVWSKWLRGGKYCWSLECVILSSLKKTSLFVKPPQEQNVPFARGVCFLSSWKGVECLCVHAYVCTWACLCVHVCVCLPEPFWCLAGRFNRCFGCHWLTQLVIIWLHSDVNWTTYKTLAKHFDLFSCFIRARPKLNTMFEKINTKTNKSPHAAFLRYTFSWFPVPLLFLTGDHQLSVCESENLKCVFVCETVVIGQSRSFKAVI